jgi:hypothetical protein
MQLGHFFLTFLLAENHCKSGCTANTHSLTSKTKKTARTCHTISDVGTELFISKSFPSNIATLAIHNPQAPKQDPPLINAECYRNHEKRKTLITCKKQNITKTENITNAKPRASSTPHDDQLSIVLSFSVIPNCSSRSSIRSQLHPSFYLCFGHTEKS